MSIHGFLKTTNFHRKWWKKRQIDWTQAYMNPDHPHRGVIVEKLKSLYPFRSILEVGCAAGANLYRIKQAFPQSDIGGIDWNEKAIETAKQYLPKASVLQVGEATDVYIGSKGADVLMSDMCYIYLDKKNFRKAILEAKRVARKGVLFCEFNHTNWFMRQMIRITTGYNAYNFRVELERIGFRDIEITKLTPKDWPETEKENGLRCIITARS